MQDWQKTIFGELLLGKFWAVRKERERQSKWAPWSQEPPWVPGLTLEQ